MYPTNCRDSTIYYVRPRSTYVHAVYDVESVMFLSAATYLTAHMRIYMMQGMSAVFVDMEAKRRAYMHTYGIQPRRLRPAIYREYSSYVIYKQDSW